MSSRRVRTGLISVLPYCRRARDEGAGLAALVRQAEQRLAAAVESSCRTVGEQQTVLNCARLLTRISPYIFECTGSLICNV